MDRDLLRHLPVILSVADRGGFSAAAAELGMSPSAVSHAIRLVEERLGVPLFSRTTRRVRLTEAGESFVDTTRAALLDIEHQFERVRSQSVASGAVGTLRLNAPRIALPLYVTPLIDVLRRDNPELSVEIFADDGWSDIVAEGFDAGIRLGDSVHADMIAVRLSSRFRAGIVAAPDYVRRCGLPKCVLDLPTHMCITYRLVTGGGVYRWELNDEGVDRAVDVGGPFVVNDYRYAVELALGGRGLAYVFLETCADELAEGRLVRVLPECDIDESGFSVYYPQRSRASPKLRALTEATREVARVLLSRTSGNSAKNSGDGLRSID